jgi:hypothetical protein
MTIVVLNPGTGPVPSPKGELAAAAIMTFVGDVLKDPRALASSPVSVMRTRDKPHDGYFGYELSTTTAGVFRDAFVHMPGAPLEQLRWLGGSQNPFAFYRLYVEGNSWLWKYAVDTAADALFGVADEEEAEEAT